jgi:hypothetical protein
MVDLAPPGREFCAQIAPKFRRELSGVPGVSKSLRPTTTPKSGFGLLGRSGEVGASEDGINLGKDSDRMAERVGFTLS